MDPIMKTADQQLAARALALLDLTDLSEQANEAGIVQLCAKAMLPQGHVAAICIWPNFVSVARRVLREGSAVKIATVVNFPAGGTHVQRVVGDISEALDDGADEIDLVFPYKSFLSGDVELATDMVAEAKATCGDKLMKVILETGEFPHQVSIQAAARAAIASGADFIKTSTGKTKVSATPAAAETMLAVIRDTPRPIGFKPSGGIRTLADAKLYLDLADRIMGPGWATPATFRFGASGLHAVLIEALTGQAHGEQADGAY
jgi:deoxyribose-phosphate aldolase